MLEAITRNWWVLLLRGLCAIVYGVLAFAWPGLTLVTLVFLYGFFALADGATAIMLGVTGRAANESWWGMVLAGVLGILAGLAALVWPGITATALLFLIAAWAIARGVLEIVAAIRLRKVIDNEWMLGLEGAASILFGVMLAAWPAAGLLTLVWLIGAAALVWGALLIALSLRLHRLRKHVNEHSAPMEKPPVRT